MPTPRSFLSADAQLPLWLAIVITLALVIVIREGSVLLCQALGIASAANIVGLLILFALLMAWRLRSGLPIWLTQASNTLLVDSGFAFLPVSAGAGLLLFALGDEFWGVVTVIVVSTLLPLWGLATLANVWLRSDTPADRHANPPTSEPSSSKSNTETGASL